MNIKQVGSILLILILLVGCQKNEGKEQYSQSKLDGVDIKDILNLVLVDSGATYSAPDSLLVQKAFAPCKLEGKDGEMQGTCPIYADGNYLVNVDENPKHDNKVEITTGGSGKGVNYLQLESENPNSIYYALNEKDYKQSDYECDDSRAGNWEFKKISTVNKKDFTIALNKNVSASSGWGWLRVYLDGTSPDKACELMGMEESVKGQAKTDVTRPELQPNNPQVQEGSKPATTPVKVSKNYTQLFVCFSDSNYLPVARTLTETLIGYLQAGQDLAYAKIIQSSSKHFNGSSVGGGCTQHGFALKELPKGEGELTKFSENNNYIFWVQSTRGVAGGAYTAFSESK